jgi:hypothetical protein
MTTLSFALLSPKKTLFILRSGILFYFIFAAATVVRNFVPPTPPPKKKKNTLGPLAYLLGDFHY